MNGVILIVSTNHPELVDDALANRPGRIDRIVTFCALDLEGPSFWCQRQCGQSRNDGPP